MEERRDTRGRNRKKIIYGILILLLLVIIGVLGVILLRSGRKEETEEAETFGGMAYEANVIMDDADSLQDAVDRLVEKAKEGQMSLHMRTEAYSEDGKTFSCYLANSEKNNYDMFMVFYLDETQQEVYRTGLIPIGGRIEEFTLEEALEPGSHEVTSDSDSYTGQIICVPQDIVNESNVAIDVNVAELTTTNVTEGITISTTAITDKVTAKSAFLYLEVVEKGADGAKFADSYNSKSTSQVVIPDASGEGSKVKKGAKNAIVTLAAGNTTATTASFKIGGSVVANPTVTDENKVVSADPWLSTDTLKISFKFTFTPKVNEVKSGS